MNNIPSIEKGTLEIGPGLIFFVKETGSKFHGAPRSAECSTTTQPTRPRVLVVDDEKLIAETCAQILKNAGLETRIAYDGFSAMELLTEFSPDYLLTDVLMPGMSGVQLAIEVTKMSPQTNILLFSGQAGISEILQEGYDQGYEFELLAKPMHPLKLLEYFKKP